MKKNKIWRYAWNRVVDVDMCVVYGNSVFLLLRDKDVVIKIKTSDPKKADKVLNQTLEMCPAGVLFANAGVKISHKPIVG